MASGGVIGVGARHANGGSDSLSQCCSIFGSHRPVEQKLIIKKNKKKTKKTSMASIVVIGVGTCHTNGGSDSPRQVEDAAANAAASSAVVIL